MCSLAFVLASWLLTCPYLGLQSCCTWLVTLRSGYWQMPVSLITVSCWLILSTWISHLPIRLWFCLHSWFHGICWNCKCARLMSCKADCCSSSPPGPWMLCFPAGGGILLLPFESGLAWDLLWSIGHDRNDLVQLLGLALRGLRGFVFTFWESSHHSMKLRRDC